MEVNKIPDQVTAKDIIQGECSLPPELDDFYIILLTGPNYRRKRSSNCQRLVKSFSEDAIYAVSNGKIKTSKHLTLEMSLKSLTNSLYM